MTRTPHDEDIASYFDSRVGCCAPKGRVDQASWHRASNLLRSSFGTAVQGLSVLELGCGAGDLLCDLVRGGAASGTGIDLSPAAVEMARRRAQADGIADRVTFRTGNASKVPVDSHDVVVLDKMICCYVDYEALLRNTLPAARQIYAFTLPRTDGAWSVLIRVALGIENLGHRIRRRGFRAYVHDEKAVHRLLREAGFDLIERRTGFAWAMRLYAKR